MKKNKSVRLSNDVSPTRYKITLTPDFKTFTFQGEEIISLTLATDTKKLTLHASELDIKKVHVSSGSKKIKGTISLNSKTETVTFTFPKTLPKGSVELHLSFSGTLNDKMHGFYRSRYEVDGEEKYLATTQFESTDARRAFPSFDEPSKKAIFDVTLIIPKHMQAISNTVVSEVREHEGEYKIVSFEPTPKMSTYLLAFIVGEFESIETKTKEGIVVRVFVTKDKKKQAEFALSTASQMLSFYNSYFGIHYPLPVLDLIAVPDFAAGAMENWGAVTYRETALLIDPDHSSLANKQRVAIVIAHELAHMWFGDLVTMEWWTHLWLNEGFASYIEYLAVDSLFPEWDMWTQFVYMDQSQALKLDGLKTTHPIEVEVYHPQEIDEIFDTISYLKGSSVIRMLAGFLGKTDFRDGLKYYLQKHQYGNAKTEDLWDAFEKVSKKPVSKIMKNWTQNPGYPLLTVSERKDSFEVSQKRFFSSTLSKKTKDKTLWHIPLRVIDKSSSEQYLLNTETLTIPKKEGWVKLNADEASFTRVKYPESLLVLFKDPIEEKKLGPVDRLGIIRDAFDLSESGDLQTDKALELASLYAKETNFTVWLQLAAGISQIGKLYVFEPWYKEYEQYVRGVFSGIGKSVGWNKKHGEKHTDTLLRSLVLAVLGTYGDKDVILRSQKLFREKIQKQKHIDPDLRGVVYTIVAEQGAEKEHAAFLKLYKEEELHQEKDKLAKALTSFRSKKLLKKTLEFSLSSDVRAQDGVRFVGWVMMNPYGRDVAWEFIQKHWSLLYERYHAGHMLSHVLVALAEFTDLKNAKAIEQFFKKNPAPSASRTISQGLEQIKSNVAWIKRDRKNLHTFLSQIHYNK